MREDPFAISTKTVSFQQIVLDVLARSRVVESSSSLESMPQDLIHLSLSQKKIGDCETVLHISSLSKSPNFLILLMPRK